MNQRIELLTKQLDFLYEKLDQITEGVSQQQVEYLLTRIDTQKRMILEEEVNMTFRILEEQ
ncbi:hypothetical protein CWE17_03515 [Synechococcus sp. BS56D]|nr:hypothetical protein CWE17_03515 [Synechococcus sp. BS56D]